MAENKNIEVGGRFHSIATGNVLAGADEILDDDKNKKQNEINTETYSLVNNINERLNSLSPDQQSALSVATKATNNETKLGYYVCDTEGNVAAKVISNATGYVLSTGGSMKVKMTNVNTVNNATLNINSTGAKALYYAGERASAINSWEAGETVEIYYDGTSFYANSVAGGSGSGDGAFDISAKTGNTYETLSAALTAANSILSASKKKGGMSIKFIQLTPASYSVDKTEGLEEQPTGTELSTDPGIEDGNYNASQLSAFATLPTSTGAANAITYWMAIAGDSTTYTKWVVTLVHTDDNKYVQYRLMSTSWSTNVSNWQGVDNIPTIGSKNIIISGGVFKSLLQYTNYIPNFGIKLNSSTNKLYFDFDKDCYLTEMIPIGGLSSVTWYYNQKSDKTIRIAFYDEDFNLISSYGQTSTASYRNIGVNEAWKYARVTFDWAKHSTLANWKLVGLDSNNTEIVLWDESYLNKESIKYFPQTLTNTQKAQVLSNLGIVVDSNPTALSDNFVKSGGVYSGQFRNAGKLLYTYIAVDNSTNKKYFAPHLTMFLTELIKVDGYASIIWNYHAHSTGLRMAFFDEGKNMIDTYGSVSGSTRTIAVPNGAIYMRGAFDNVNHSTLRDWSIIGVDSNDEQTVLWDEVTDDYKTTISAIVPEIVTLRTDVNKNTSDIEAIEGQIISNDVVVGLTPYSNSKRLNVNGSVSNYSGFSISRLISVSKGDIIIFKTIYDTGSNNILAGYSDRDGTVTETFNISSVTASDSVRTFTYKVVNDATKYIRLGIHKATSAITSDNFGASVIYANRYIVDGKHISNNFPYALDKAPKFKQKLLSGDDVYITLLGDSITQISNQSANANPENLPPFMERKNWCYWLWNKFNKSADIIYRRSDYQGFFTLNGTFTTPNNADNSFNNSYSTDADAWFSFDWNLATYEKTHLVMPINGTQCSQIKIEIISDGSATDDKVEIYSFSTGTWGEANGFVLNLRLSGAAGNLLSCNNNRYKLRRKANSGTVTIKVSKNIADSDKLQFWGVEQWNGQNVFINNAAYGGYATYQLQDGNISSVKNSHPDLVLFEMTLINNYDDRKYQSNPKELMINDFHDYIWGDRTGSENSLSLKNISNSWNNFEVLLIVPHWRRQWVNGNLFRKVIGTTTVVDDALQCYNAVKALVIQKEDLNMVDIGSALKWEADKRGITLEQSYDGDEAGDMLSINKFCQDTVHLNDLGSKLYGDYIAPIFDVLN